MSLSILASSATVDYTSFRRGVNSRDLLAPFYADLKQYEDVSWSDTTFTEEALSSTSRTLSITNNSEYAVDSNGFFGTDLNKTLGIPSTVKIHQAMYVQAVAYVQVQGENVDPLELISKVWNLFNTIAGNTLDPNNDGYVSQTEINTMPKSYISKGALTDGIVSVQNTIDEMNDMAQKAYKIQDITQGSLDMGFRGFMAMGEYSRIDTDPNIGFYAHREVFEQFSGVAYDENLPSDQLAVGELFDSFFYQKVDWETAGYVLNQQDSNSLCINPTTTKDYYTFLDSGKTMETYLSDTKGESYLEQLKKEISTLKNGEVNPELANFFFAELDREQKSLLVQYKENRYASLNPKSTDTSTTSLSNIHMLTQTLLEAKQSSSPVNESSTSALSSILS